MKISLDWLNDYIETGLSAEKIADILSDQGFPCEGIEYIDGDAVIDIEVTSNRGDCLGLISIARELAAATGKPLKKLDIDLPESEKDINELASVEICQPDLCFRYTARVIEGVKVGQSPDWMRKRIEALGLRSVNNVVDATNYAMFETGQPPHAFDYDKIKDGKIIVRSAVLGEQLVSIDGTKCNLDEKMLIIADAKKPIAIAGVMGGLDTEVTDSTTSILLEDAYFDPVSVRTTSRKLTLPSDAAFRFERVVDVQNIEYASKRTAQLIIQVAGGKAAKGVIDKYPKKPQPKKVSLRFGRIKKILGIDVPKDTAMKILKDLYLEPKLQDENILCSVPSWRNDIYREIDLIEEVARIYGYDKIPLEDKINIEIIPVEKRQKTTTKISRYLNSCGFYETINVTFIDEHTAKLFAPSADTQHLNVKDVSRKSDNILRSSLIGSLFNVLKTNINAKNRPCRIFEIADTFVASGEKDSLPVEKNKLALLCDDNLRAIRGVIEGLIHSFSKEATVELKPSQLNWANPAAEISVNGNVIGLAGIACEKVKQKFDLKDIETSAAEIDLQALTDLANAPGKLKPIPKYPEIERDLSVIVEEQLPWSKIVDAVNQQAPPQLEEVRFIDIFRGKNIEPGKKSVTLSLLFRDEDGTLTHKTVDSFEAKIVENLKQKTNAELRTV